MIVRDVCGHFRLRLPVELPARAAIQIDDRARGADGDLVVAVFVRIEFDLHGVAIEESLIVVLRRSDVQLLAGAFFTADSEIDVLAICGPIRP